MNYLLVCVMYGDGGGSNRIHLIVILFQTTGSNLCIRLAVGGWGEGESIKSCWKSITFSFILLMAP